MTTDTKYQQYLDRYRGVLSRIRKDFSDSNIIEKKQRDFRKAVHSYNDKTRIAAFEVVWKEFNPSAD